MPPRITAWCALTCALAASTPAAAGPRPYGFVQGTDSLPEMVAEIENWIGLRTRPGEAASWDWWVGPVLGVSDRIETELFFILEQPATEDSPARWDETWLQVSWLATERGTAPVDARVQLAGSVPTELGDVDVWLTGVVSKDLGCLDVTANLAPWIKIEPGGVIPYVTERLGASCEILPGTRLGAEGTWSTKWEEGEVSHRYYGGPALAYGRGRFWATTSVQLGPEGDGQRSRLILGVNL